MPIVMPTFFPRVLSVPAFLVATSLYGAGALTPVGMRCEYLEQPLAIESASPRLSWRVESTSTAQHQSAYRILVAGSLETLADGQGDLWDSGKVDSAQTQQVRYQGRSLESGTPCWWKVRVWDRDGAVSAWSSPAHWTMGLTEASAIRAAWISYQDSTPLHTDRQELFLPPARHYRKEFDSAKTVKRAWVHLSALGLVELHLNGQKVGDAAFEPGWADYHKRVHYRTHDVTPLLHQGDNCIGAIVAEGWYSGYVGYGLLAGHGPNRVGRYFYGKTPALWVQLEIEFADGSKQFILSDSSWKVTGDGPIREADMIMGEAHDARREMPGWDKPGFDASVWDSAILAEQNGSTPAVFFDNTGPRAVDLGFRRPPVMQAYAAPPIRITEELPAKRITEAQSGVFIFDLSQNFAGIIRLKLRGERGTQVKIRYGEMLHPDGRLMTENLRRARATDFYTLRGDPAGEVWQPRFTYHGFQYVELTGLVERPDLDSVTGLVMHNDTPLVGEFACSDGLLSQFWKNTQWTQRANFIEMPTDCPQRDERLGWMGDAQAYVRAASYNADVAAFFTKWLDDVEEAQREFGAYPDYCPYPMGHGTPGKTFGTAWTDAGIICPWTIWQVYGDTEVVNRHWDSMSRFMDWRNATTAPDRSGASIGNTWGDWLNVNEPTPIEYIDTCYHALTCRMMAQMAESTGRPVAADAYRQRFNTVRAAFAKNFVRADGRLSVDTQTAYVLALWVGLFPDGGESIGAARLAEKIRQNDTRMTTGFLGTKPLLPVLTAHGYHNLAVRLFQSREFPSWGYEVANGANSVWERWDSYTREHGFNGQNGNQNASMNSFSHYAFGAVTEWMFRDLAGIDTDGPGFQRMLLRPGVPALDPDAPVKPINWVRAAYDSPHGQVRVHWRRTGPQLDYEVELPANTRATLFLPAKDRASVQAVGSGLTAAQGVEFVREEAGRVIFKLESGQHHFHATLPEFAGR